MREINTSKITEVVSALCASAITNLPEDVLSALNTALKNETSKSGREILRQIIQNAKIAAEEKLPLCQDTGTAVLFIELGQEVAIINGNFNEAVQEGVRQGYKDGRKSIVADPLARNNTKDNTPAIIHLDIVTGDKIKIKLSCKGGGAENKSTIKMFNPSTNKEEIERFILETVKNNSPEACPPVIIGVGIGSNFDGVALLAKKALLRKVGMHSSAFSIKKWEKELLEKINKLGIGPMGLGGKTTALAINIERAPCHISSLPVAINFDCHAHRYGEAVI
ncbi:MAG: fumarate hydratase [Candidatus Margulisiibacteriota bacterium]